MHSSSFIHLAFFSYTIAASANGLNARQDAGNEQDELLFKSCYSDPTTVGRNATESTLPCDISYTILVDCDEATESENQACFCESNHFFDYFGGCTECLRLHGAPEQELAEGSDHLGFVPLPYVSAASSSYCSMDSTSVVNVVDFLDTFTLPASVKKGEYTSMSNILGSSTDVSNYFTSTATNGGTVTSPASAGSTAQASSRSGSAESADATTTASPTGTSSATPAAATTGAATGVKDATGDAWYLSALSMVFIGLCVMF
ncbi:MAG: hypothetical protein M1837_006198 [Sclerophora amabilis]|nr:MAG: hypothetical protein M1837_006198 [Sclerophora amabilis]